MKNLNELRLIKALLLSILVFTLLACGSSGGDYSQSYSKTNEKSQEDINKQVAVEALNELEEEYKEEFELESINYIRENDSYVMFVHPKAEPDISFRVIRWAMGGRANIDNYTQTRRYKQTIKLFKPFANRINERNFTFANIGAADRADIRMMQEKPYWLVEKYTIEELIELYRGKSGLYIKMYFFFDITDKNKYDVYEVVYDMLLYIKELGISELILEIEFYDEEYFRDVDVHRMLAEAYDDNRLRFDAFSYHYALSMIKNFDEYVEDLLKEIQSPKDVKKILRYKVFPESKWEMWDLVYEDEYKKIIKEKGSNERIKSLQEHYDYTRDKFLMTN